MVHAASNEALQAEPLCHDSKAGAVLYSPGKGSKGTEGGLAGAIYNLYLYQLYMMFFFVDIC